MTRQRQPLTRRQREFFDYLRGRMEAGQDAPSLDQRYGFWVR